MYGNNSSNDKTITPVELKILQTLRKKPKSESRIVKDTKVSKIPVSDTITELMIKGFIDRIRVKRFYFISCEYFSITVEGLEVLNNTENSTLTELFQLFINRLEQKSSQDPLLRLAVGGIKAGYYLARFILK